MRRLFLTVAIAVLGFTASYAQQAEKTERADRTKRTERAGRVKLSAEERAEKAATALQTKLSLNADQKAKIKQIELDRIKEHDGLRKKDEATMKAKFEERKAAMKAHQDKIDAVLTADQKTKLAAEREEVKAKMKERMKDRKGRFHKAPKAEQGK
jgi:type III secretory pathway component EscV